jgi:hypothetical protein
MGVISRDRGTISRNMASMVENSEDFKKIQLFERMRKVPHPPSRGAAGDGVRRLGQVGGRKNG